MNLPRPVAGLALLAALVLLTSCATSTISRIDSNRAAYDSWPLEIQEAVLNNRVKIGMTPDQVRTSVGKPTEVVQRSVQAGDDEVWVYRSGGSSSGGGLLSNTNISLGGSIGGVGVSGNPGSMGSSSNGEEHEVVFHDGVVSRSDFP